jgi:predicted GIY-YIG superfamily endonuclease
MNTLYVLKLENSKYYVGITTNLNNRLKAHFSNQGSSWTKKFKPLEVIETIEPACKKLEKKKTMEYMRKYGYLNVRGAGWTQCQDIPKPSFLR